MAFSPETKQALIACGWYEGRQIDLSAYERAVAEAGHTDGQAARAFLRCYGDLEIDPDDFDVYIDTSLSVPTSHPVSAFWASVFDRNLYTIGTCAYDFMTLLMDPSGRVYRFWGGMHHAGRFDLERITDSGEEAIEWLCNEGRLHKQLTGEIVASHD